MTEDQIAPALVAELWYPAAPDLAAPAVLDALRAVSPQTEAQGGSLTVPHTADGSAPLVTVVMAGSELGIDGKTLPDVGQTWAWPDAETAVAGCRASVLLTEMKTADSTPQQRVAALTRVVAALVSTTAPAVISWAQSQRVSDPEAFLADDLDGLLNVRLFTVAGDAGALVMDTLGLHVFGLPDVQCHFRDREPGEIAELLFTTGVYLFQAGDVIEDGNTISGPDGEGRYVCRREPALLDPARPVLDVDLGDPYAAGARDRG
ncbi:MAG TPA: DUF4261 domain-containing protein [Propionibacteriaceae bacterium]